MRLVHRVHTGATAAQVWELLADPSCWPVFEVFLRRVSGVTAPTAAGQHLLGVLRGVGLRVPIDVVECVPESRLRLVVRTLPGVGQEQIFELTPAVRGGCDITVSVVVDGLFAHAAVVPLSLASGLTARVLAAQAQRRSRSARRTSRGAA